VINTASRLLSPLPLDKHAPPSEALEELSAVPPAVFAVLLLLLLLEAREK
jgi:hypothetical protein